MGAQLITQAVTKKRAAAHIYIQRAKDTKQHPTIPFFYANTSEKRLPQELQGTNLKHASFHGEHADIEGSAPQVEDDDVRSRDSRVLGLLVPVEAVCQGGSRGLVDDAAYVETLGKIKADMNKKRDKPGWGRVWVRV